MIGNGSIACNAMIEMPTILVNGMRVRADSHFLFAPNGAIKGDNLRRWRVISREHQINDEIRAREVRVVGAEGEQVGIKLLREALQMAVDLNMDLVNIAPTAKPPVCRIMDYGKFRYEQQKKEKEARKNQKIVDIKEVWFRANIDENDYQTKFRNVVKFLNEGDKVKCSVRFRGREITHASVGQRILDRLAKEVAELCVMERVPKLEGRSMIMILAPKNN
ncbi:Translation initiation factor IF-3 [Paenibacillus plantiphilus]|uniref:Translation initiation factor IF-3 n=1 Tax=Paenibacillus plantiphilus TaxID=2905650 RepID=A0ABN8FPW1_9BACL|nr:Translation initiation factor IF-3 [Paenibacillus plantiphilus]